MLIGAKIEPEKSERDLVISEFIKGKNKTEIIKQALYRMALQEKHIGAGPNVDSRMFDLILEKLNSLQSGTATIQQERFSMPQRTNDYTPPSSFDSDMDMPSLDALETDSPDSIAPPTMDAKQMAKNLLGNFKNFNI